MNLGDGEFVYAFDPVGATLLSQICGGRKAQLFFEQKTAAPALIRFGPERVD
jgi:hypothetical protein